MNAFLDSAATTIIPMVIAIVLPRIAQGWAARLLGDRTATECGRLSANPLRYIDTFGTIILPFLMHLAGSPMFGWARPVPIDYDRLRHPRRDMVLVGAAAPASNIVIAILAAVVIGLLVRGFAAAVAHDAGMQVIVANLQNLVLFTLSIGMFNLLPIPPFDGSRILRGLLPPAATPWLDRVEPYGIIVFLALFLILPALAPSLHLLDRVILPPMQWMLHQLNALIFIIAGRQPVT